LLLLLGASAAFSCGSVAGPAPSAPLAPLAPSEPVASAAETTCPLETPEQWQQFLERYAGDPRWVKTCEDKPCDAGYSRLVEEEIKGVLDRCQGFVAAHPPI